MTKKKMQNRSTWDWLSTTYVSHFSKNLWQQITVKLDRKFLSPRFFPLWSKTYKSSTFLTANDARPKLNNSFIYRTIYPLPRQQPLIPLRDYLIKCFFHPIEEIVIFRVKAEQKDTTLIQEKIVMVSCLILKHPQFSVTSCSSIHVRCKCKT